MYKKCNLCMRSCGVDRTAGQLGYCKMSDKIYISRADLHFWEEPVISGTRGSGTIFFSGCSLGCIYCQNREISRGKVGAEVSESELAAHMLRLQGLSAHNINFVTPTHYAPSVRRAVLLARDMGLKIPVVYNTGSYDSPETVRLMQDAVDIFLPDLKYYLGAPAEKYSHAKDLPKASRAAIDEMVKITGAPVLDGEGIMARGVIVRILLLPGHVAEAKLNVKYLYERYGDSIYISLMSQYTPMPDMPKPLDRRVSLSEYRELCEYAGELGITRAFVQSRESAGSEYIPPFNT